MVQTSAHNQKHKIKCKQETAASKSCPCMIMCSSTHRAAALFFPWRQWQISGPVRAFLKISWSLGFRSRKSRLKKTATTATTRKNHLRESFSTNEREHWHMFFWWRHTLHPSNLASMVQEFQQWSTLQWIRLRRLKPRAAIDSIITWHSPAVLSKASVTL